MFRKNILLEASQYSDLTSNSFHDIQRRIEAGLQNINPPDEYREFTERHRLPIFSIIFAFRNFFKNESNFLPQNRTSPPTQIVFQFDQALIEDKDTLGKLQPNTLTVDNLTIDWLRNRLTELETSVKECQEKQSKLQMENGTNLPIPTPSPLTNGIGRKENNK